MHAVLFLDEENAGLYTEQHEKALHPTGIVIYTFLAGVSSEEEMYQKGELFFVIKKNGGRIC